MGEKHRKIAKEIESKLKTLEARFSDMRRGLEHDDPYIVTIIMAQIEGEIAALRDFSRKFDEE